MNKDIDAVHGEISLTYEVVGEDGTTTRKIDSVSLKGVCARWVAYLMKEVRKSRADKGNGGGLVNLHGSRPDQSPVQKHTWYPDPQLEAEILN